MEIEIVTTKKKLTKSIVSQMQNLSLSEIDNVNVIGFVNNIDVNSPRVLILEIDRFEYRKVYWDWRLGTKSLYRNLKGHWIQKKEFKSEDDCRKYYNAIQEYKKQAVQIYI